MAEEIPDEKFKSEVMRFIDVAAKKFDGLATDVRTNSFHLDRLETKIDRVDTNVEKLSSTVEKLNSTVMSLSSDVRTLSGQFNDVGVMAVEDHQRLDNLEERMNVLEGEIH